MRDLPPIIGREPPAGWNEDFGTIAGPAPPIFFDPPIIKEGFAKAPPAFLPLEKPKLGLLVTTDLPVPEPVIAGLMVGFEEPDGSSPPSPPSIYCISLAIKSSILSAPNLAMLTVDIVFVFKLNCTASVSLLLSKLIL